MTDDEAFEIAVRHVLHDDLHWASIDTEEQARAVVLRLRAKAPGVTPEVAAERVRAEHYATLIDLTDPAQRAAYFGETA